MSDRESQTYVKYAFVVKLTKPRYGKPQGKIKIHSLRRKVRSCIKSKLYVFWMQVEELTMV